ncbi:MAG: DUF262 domain-containing HNH endonuclease family protein [Hyphomicrobiaceae bacterium]|nr:DUF262 domain-containing protein [Hyphomicrobiaceae bacterium]
MSHKISHVSLRQLLAAERLFVMARYQRHYEWSRREMEHLTNDIGDAFEEHLANPGANVCHFFNSVILYPDKNGALQVVDGQQRLTSLALLLAVAREQLANTAATSEIDAILALPPITPGGPRRQRLTLHRGDNETFGSIVLTGAGIPTEESKLKNDRPGAERLLNNAYFARNWFVSIRPEDRAALVKFIADSCNFVEIHVANETEAFRIFETVNSRGSPISPQDVLRFSLIEYATDDPKKREQLFARWDELEAELGGDGLRRFIANWRSRASGRIRARTPMHRAIIDSFDIPAQALDFLERELNADIALFAEINSADAAISDPAAKDRIDMLLQSLRLIKFDDWVPIASATLECWRKEPEKVIQVLTELERHSWYYYLNSTSKGIAPERREQLNGVMKLLKSGDSADAITLKLRLDARELERLRNALPDQVDPRSPWLRSLMVRLEMALTPHRDRINREEVTVEHILPKSATTQAWLAEFNFDQSLMYRYAENPGNLCVLPEALNNLLGSKIYPTKQKIIRNYGAHKKYALAADFHTEQRWNAAVIERRAEWMRATLRQIFNL